MKKHRMPDADAQRYSWNFVKYMVAKSRAETLREVADLADLTALIYATSSEPLLQTHEALADQLRKLASSAEESAASLKVGR